MTNNLHFLQRRENVTPRNGNRISLLERSDTIYEQVHSHKPRWHITVSNIILNYTRDVIRDAPLSGDTQHYQVTVIFYPATRLVCRKLLFAEAIINCWRTRF
jgi:hypothetical protein